MTNDIWVLGATGRSGRAIAAKLAAGGSAPVLVGRNTQRIDALAASLGGRGVTAQTPAQMAAAIRREGPAVVINTVGPFQHTASELSDATLAAGSYVDLANDVETFRQHRGRDAAARRNGHTIVTGAGFGVTATESILTRLMDGRPTAARARVDMIPSMAIASGALGEALAASLLHGLPGVPGGGRFRGRRIVDGRLAPVAIGGRRHTLVTPDGDSVSSALVPFGDLLAAERASGAPFVEAGSSEAPSGALRQAMRAALPLLHVGALRRLATRRLAAVTVSERSAPRAHSWAHAEVRWPDGTVRSGWLAMGDAGDATATVAAEVALRLARGEGRPGSYTPAALFGCDLAEACGGEYLLADQAVPR